MRVRDLAISYGGEPVLEGASLAVGEGGFVSLVGPSGSGKSSLLRAVIGLQQPLSGTIETTLARSQVGILVVVLLIFAIAGAWKNTCCAGTERRSPR